MDARQLSSLLYRDHLQLKHSSRDRLQGELDTAKILEASKFAKADDSVLSITDGVSGGDPLLQALLDHLPEDPCPQSCS